MGRIDYYHDSNAPSANSLVVGSSAVVTNSGDRILLQRRRDSGNRALPGGTMDIGETLAQSIIREVREETGFDVQIQRIVGIYSDPAHVFAYDDGEVRQEFNICVACTIRAVRSMLARSQQQLTSLHSAILQACRCMNRFVFAYETIWTTRPPCCVSIRQHQPGWRQSRGA